MKFYTEKHLYWFEYSNGFSEEVRFATEEEARKYADWPECTGWGKVVKNGLGELKSEEVE